MSRLIVQKYGGSSLADAERIRHVAGRIARDRRDGADLVVVVSAMGDTTDHLTELAAAITDEPDPREMDLLLATGEHMSGTLVAMALHARASRPSRSRGPRPASAPIQPTAARASPTSTRPACGARLERGRVVIVAGFQGVHREGYDDRRSPRSGAAARTPRRWRWPRASRADACEIYTDVEGIFTADPRVVPDAQLIPTIGYEEMLELAHQGAQVMQTRAVELGWVNDVVIRVRSTFSDHPGTSIQEVSAVELRDKVRAMALDRKVAKVTIVGVPDRPGIARSIFEPMADQGLNVDMIVQNVGHDGSTDMSFTVERANLARTERLLELLGKELGFARRADRRGRGQGLHRGRGHPQPPRLRRPDVRCARRRGHQHQHDLDLGDTASPASSPRTRSTPRPRPSTAPSGCRSRRRPRGAGGGQRWLTTAGGRDPTSSPVSSASSASTRRRRSCAAGSRTASTRSASRSPTSRPRGVAVSIASGRTGPGSSLLVSAGFRPRGLSPAMHAWRLPAIASMAMLGAATSLLGPTADRLALKWPNDIIAVHHGRLRKVAGVLTESSLEGDRLATSIVGLGVNVDWAGGDYPGELADSMWSLSEASGRRRIDRRRAAGGLARAAGAALRGPRRPATSTACAGPTPRSPPGRPSRSRPARAASGGTAVGVDRESGSLLVRTGPGQPLRTIAVGDVVRCSVDDAA